MLLSQFRADGLAPHAALDCQLLAGAPDAGLGVTSCS
jgi:hypothetical protein